MYDSFHGLKLHMYNREEVSLEPGYQARQTINLSPTKVVVAAWSAYHSKRCCLCSTVAVELLSTKTSNDSDHIHEEHQSSLALFVPQSQFF
jgi:hypothetical protein